MAADLRERVARALFAHDGIGASEFRPTWEAVRDDYRAEWLKAADAVLAELAPELQPQAEPVAWDDWIERCTFEVTFDGETTHPITLGGHIADATGIKRMTFELSGIVSRDDLDEMDDAINEAMRVANTGAHRKVIKDAYGRIRPLLSELATGDLR